MIKHCPQLRDKLKNIKLLYSDYCLEFEQAKSSKEYDLALNIQTRITEAILELGMKVNPDKYSGSYLTEIERKHKANIPLTKAEIIFLYDMNFKGKVRDKYFRLIDILRTRNPKEDAPIVFDCEPYEIAWDLEEIDKHTKAYIGPWNGDVFHVLIGYPNIKHLYESFPERKIFITTLETDPNINSPVKAKQALKDKNIYLSEWGKDILEKTEFSQTPEVYNLVRFTVEQLGLKQGATTDKIYKRAKELVLELCPAEVGPQLRLKYTGRELFWIAMKQISDLYGYPRMFRLHGDDAMLLLSGYQANPNNRWDTDDEFVFRFHKEDKKEK